MLFLATRLCRQKSGKAVWLDCHGLPVEFEAEKELGLKGKQDIEKMGVYKFNEYCRSIVLRYTEEWKKSVQRMGLLERIKNIFFFPKILKWILPS